jgi:hypothetical protein
LVFLNLELDLFSINKPEEVTDGLTLIRKDQIGIVVIEHFDRKIKVYKHQDLLSKPERLEGQVLIVSIYFILFINLKKPEKSIFNR